MHRPKLIQTLTTSRNTKTIDVIPEISTGGSPLKLISILKLKAKGMNFNFQGGKR